VSSAHTFEIPPPDASDSTTDREPLVFTCHSVSQDTARKKRLAEREAALADADVEAEGNA
jgi:hypothetical protein